MIPMTRRVTTKHEIPPSSFQHPRIRSGVESSSFEVMDPGQKHAGVTGWGDFMGTNEHEGNHSPMGMTEIIPHPAGI
jgi:hypothetical protein